MIIISFIIHILSVDNLFFTIFASPSYEIVVLKINSFLFCLTSKTINEYPSHDVYQWADAIGLVYAITDRRSFDYVKQMKPALDTCCLPVVLVANKADMVHLRQVSTEEGKENYRISFQPPKTPKK